VTRAESSPARGLVRLDGLIEGGIVLVLLGAPLPFGAVLPWAQGGIETVVGLLCAMVLVRALWAGELSVRRTPLLWPGLAMLLLVGVQLSMAAGSISPHATWESARLYVAYFAFLVVLGAHLQTRGRIVRLVIVTVVGGVALATLGLLNQALGRAVILWFPKQHYLDRLTATFVNPNHQALYFSIVLFLALGLLVRQGARPRAGASAVTRASVPAAWTIGPIPRILLMTGVIVLAVALLLTASRGGLLSVLAGIIVMVGLTLHGRRNRWVPLALLASVGIFAGYAAWFRLDLVMERIHVVTKEPFGDLRWAVWEGTLAAFREAPLHGVGLGAFQDAFRPHQPESVGHWRLVDYAHNDYLQLLVETGVIGILVVGWALVSLLGFVVPRWAGRRDPAVRGLTIGALGALTAVSVHSATDFGLHLPANALLLVLIAALLPAVVTLRAHRTGFRVDLAEWRVALSGTFRRSAVVATIVLTVVAAAVPVPLAVADWQLRSATTSLVRRGPADGASTQNDLVQALDRLVRAARHDPWNPEIQLSLAIVSDELARRVWRHGVAPDGRRLRQPASPVARLEASQELLATALVAYERGIDGRPRAATAHDRYAWFLGRLEEIRRALAGTPAPVASTALAASLSGETLLPRALEHLREAIRQDPGNPNRHRSLGLFALTNLRALPSGRSLVAEGFRQALVLDRESLTGIADLLLTPPVDSPDLLLAAVPPRVPHLIDLGRLLDWRDRRTAADSAFETALGVASGPPEQAAVRLAHGQVLLRRKDVSRALAELRQALVVAPKSPEIFATLGDAYEAAERWADAESAHGSAVILAAESAPGEVNSYRVRLAGYLTRRGELDRALAVRRQVLADAPQDPWAYFSAGYLHELRGEATEAYREYRRAGELARIDWGVNSELARAYARQGHLQEAVTAYETAVRLAPQPAELRMDLAALLTRIGRREQAIEQYRLVLAREPDHEAARRALGALGMTAIEAARWP
jgi:tetratricopeptide (TPR) repeat protein/O-antigen ligase